MILTARAAESFNLTLSNPTGVTLGAPSVGYDFWLTKLNDFGGNFVNAEMVKALITSDEYLQRFGP